MTSTTTGSTTSSAGRDAQDELRVRLRAMWASVADAWAAHADELDEMRAGVTAAMLARARVASGQRVLELACGSGDVGLAAARRVGTAGEVVLTDFILEMTKVAAARARERGLDHVRTRVRDLEDIAEPACAYDVVLCREGVMFAPDPARAVREIRRVLRPDGRAVLAVWGPRERNPWLGLLFDAVSAQTGHPVPPPGVPGPFALCDGRRVAALLEAAGFTEVVVDEVPTPMCADSFDSWWTRTTSLAGPLAGLLAALPQSARRAIRTRLRADVASYTRADGRLELPGVTLLATARRPRTASRDADG